MKPEYVSHEVVMLIDTKRCRSVSEDIQRYRELNPERGDAVAPNASSTGARPL